MENKHLMIIAMMIGAISLQLSGIQHWAEATSPQFIAGVLTSIATTLIAMFTARPGTGDKADRIDDPSRLLRGPGVKSLIIAIALGALALLACSPPSSVVTRPGQVAYRADQVVHRVGELQVAVIDSYDHGLVDEANAKTIVAYCVAINKLLKESPEDMEAVRSGWAELNKLVPYDVKHNLRMWTLWQTIDLLVSETRSA